MALETAIAQSHATREASADERNVDNLWTRADFARQAPGMDWPAFFAAAGLSKQDSLRRLAARRREGAAALVASQPLAGVAGLSALSRHRRHAEVLPRAFAEQSFALLAPKCRPAAADPRAQRAMEATQQAMSGMLGRMYVERYFPAEQQSTRARPSRPT